MTGTLKASTLASFQSSQFRDRFVLAIQGSLHHPKWQALLSLISHYIFLLFNIYVFFCIFSEFFNLINCRNNKFYHLYDFLQADSPRKRYHSVSLQNFEDFLFICCIDLIRLTFRNWFYLYQGFFVCISLIYIFFIWLLAL